jgi:hypothetical protein
VAWGDAVEADQVQARTRHQRGQALHEFQRRHFDVGGAFARPVHIRGILPCD